MPMLYGNDCDKRDLSSSKDNNEYRVGRRNTRVTPGGRDFDSDVYVSFLRNPWVRDGGTKHVNESG